MKYIIMGLLLFTTAHAGITQVPFHNTLFEKRCCLDITHAGGSIQGHAYTNTKEALDANYALGRRVFELDFTKTKDDHWVLSHGWKEWAEASGHTPSLSGFKRIAACLDGEPEKPSPPTLAEFVARQLFGQFTPLTLPDLAQWMTTHPEVTVIVDTRKDLPELYQAMHTYPIMMHHLVFQVYKPQDIQFLKSKNIPTARMIFSNYQAKLPNEQLITLMKNEHIGALTINLSHALSDASHLRAALPNTPIYVHGKPAAINGLQVQYQLMKDTMSGFYLE